jgi:glycosyltransferase involved in cell wall biosynthesis
LYLVELAKGLADLGHSVDVVLASHQRMDELAGHFEGPVRVHRIPFANTYDRLLRSFGAAFDWTGIANLSKRLSEFDCDVIHLVQQNTEDGLDLLSAANQTSRPVLATIHVTRSMSNLKATGGWFRDRLVRQALKRSENDILATAQTCCDDLLGLGIDESRLHLVWNGVAPAQGNERHEMRRELGLGGHEYVIGTIARLEPQKNPLFIPRLLSRLPESVRMVWIGDGSLMSAMREEAAKHGVEGRLLLPGWKTKASRFLPAFDTFVLPSVYEGFPLAILEAMAHGLPSVASNVDGIGEAIVDGATGFICPCDDIDAWMNRIEKLIVSNELRSQFGAAALSRFESRFSRNAMAAGTAAAYRSVIAKVAQSRRSSSP